MRKVLFVVLILFAISGVVQCVGGFGRLVGAEESAWHSPTSNEPNEDWGDLGNIYDQDYETFGYTGGVAGEYVGEIVFNLSVPLYCSDVRIIVSVFDSVNEIWLSNMGYSFTADEPVVKDFWVGFNNETLISAVKVHLNVGGEASYSMFLREMALYGHYSISTGEQGPPGPTGEGGEAVPLWFCILWVCFGIMAYFSKSLLANVAFILSSALGILIVHGSILIANVQLGLTVLFFCAIGFALLQILTRVKHI
jgi:hypothetical protein